MKRLAAVVAIVLAVTANALPALAAQYVQDGASMFSAATVSQLNQEIGNFNAQTGKEIVVVTVPSLNGETVQNAAQTVFSEQRINGVLIFIAKNERKDIIVPGRATAQFFPASTTASIRQQMESSFRNGDFDGGITTAVSSILDVFRSHLNSAPGNATAYGRNYPAPYNQQRPVATRTGVHISMFWWIILIVIGFLVIRSIFRAMSGPRYYGGPGGPMGGGPGYGPGPGYGGPGYGGYGGGFGGGGGGFWSGMLGGLGGAFLGNELFNRGGGGTYIDPNVAGGGVAPGDQGGGWGGNAPDAGGWGNDAGQADMGSSSSGDFGGGGFGGGDFGGGGGGDFGGGGGGDSGGGW